MLLDELRKAIEDMEEIRDLEQDSQDSQKQNRIDKLYVTEVDDNHKIVSAIENSRKFAAFIPSPELKNEILRLLRDLQKCTESGLAQEYRLKIVQNGKKNIKYGFETEWSVFYKGLTDKKLHTLTTIKEITQDKEKTGYTINKIRNAAVVSYENDNRVRLLAEGLVETDSIFAQLGLEKESEIMVFLDKVADGKATLLDLTDTVAKWIEEKNLTEKFFVRCGV